MKLKKEFEIIWLEQVGSTCGSGATVEVEIRNRQSGDLIKRLITCPCGRGCGNKDCVRDDWGYHDTDIEEFREKEE